ncbi:outer membrane beta-barrel protein [Chryseolinea lacunae]|uniref:PorT family protein n=1 Tax=Chryseolinea lacunae TaxID=2801331 RepID=A0ABS1KVJ4_9BACT|nr:outer membrane beta-barrel protein [Chryseolinea lacunae]MBL0743471.1 PorT family protein [Chryseolinea lacunae]
MRAYRQASFRTSERGDATDYAPDQLAGYGYAGNARFESRSIDAENGQKEQLFLELLVRGTVSLFRVDNSFFMEKKGEGKLMRLTIEHTTVERDGRQVPITNNRYLGVINLMMHDCATIKKSLRGMALSEKKLTHLVERYNACMGTEAETFKVKMPWLRLGAGVMTGVVQSNLIISSDQTYMQPWTSPYRKSNAIFGGVAFHLTSPRVNEKFALLVELQYLKSSFYSYTDVNSGFGSARNYASVSITDLRIPLGLRYTFSNKGFAPYLALGVNNIIHSSGSSSMRREEIYHSDVQSVHWEPLPLLKHQFGVWGGVGAAFAVHPKLNAFVEVRYERANTLVNSQVLIPQNLFKSHINNLQLIIGLRTK